MKYKMYTNVLNVYSRKYPSPTEATKIQRGGGGGGGPKEVISKRVEGGFLIMEIPGGGGDMTSSPEIGGGSKTKVPLGLDSFWNYTKVIIKDYGLHFDLVD